MIYFMTYEDTVLWLFQLYMEAREIIDRSGLVVYVCALREKCSPFPFLPRLSSDEKARVTQNEHV